MQVKDLSPDYILIDRDIDKNSICEYLDIINEYSYLFVKLDKSQADYSIIYGSNSAYLQDSVVLLWKDGTRQ